MTGQRPGWLLPALLVSTLFAAGGVFVDLGVTFTRIRTASLVVLAGVALGWIGFAVEKLGLAVAGIVATAVPLIAGAVIFAPVCCPWGTSRR